jgi:hypothetical protein
MTEKLTVVQALAAVMEDVRGVGKDGFHDAPGAKFKFRGIDAVVNAVGPMLRKHHVIVTPQLISVDRRDVTTSGGKAARETCVVVKYVWTGPDGSTLETVVPGEAMDNGDKGTAKAMSVAFRIALLQALCLPTDDVDPDAQSYERGGPAERSQQNGRPRAVKDEFPPLDTVSSARGELAAFVEQKGYALPAVAAEYAKRAGKGIGDETDPKPVRAFLEQLRRDPVAVLGDNAKPVAA